MYYPSVIETVGRSSKAFDLPTKLLQDRIIYLCGVIDEESANMVIMQLLWLQADNEAEPINLYINSPGGDVYQGLGIRDIMDGISCKVNTVGVGLCASMGAYLLAAGTGHRSATKNCRIMIHSVSSGSSGTFHDIEVDYEETKYLQDTMINDITEFTKGKATARQIKDKTMRDCYMNVDEAIGLGLIDKKV